MFVFHFQAEVCSTALTDAVCAVVHGTDSCVLSFGHAKTGKYYSYKCLNLFLHLKVYIMCKLQLYSNFCGYV